MSNPVVKIKQGEVRGLSVTSANGKKYNIFSGIPYAEPPIGDLRFKDPVPVKNWDGIRDATKEGGLVAQIDMFTNLYVGGDDCLYLNVYSPQHQGSDLLPVIVYIHGGGFRGGSGRKKQYDPELKVEKDVVVVSFNFRVGVLGFLCTDPINARGDMGMKDQHLVFLWVQDNIVAFHGDPNNVTLFGYSAGSALVEFHMLAESCKGLFHKAIARSGSVFNPWAITRNPVEMAERLAKKFGYSLNSEESLFDFINKIDTERLVKACGSLVTSEDLNNGIYSPFTPLINVFDGYDGYINGDPTDLFKSGNYNKVPTISGLTNKEGILPNLEYTILGLRDSLNKSDDYIKSVPNILNKNIKDLSDRLRQVYKPQKDFDIIIDYLTDNSFFGGIACSLKQKIKNNPGNNYFYCFTYDGSMNLGKKFAKSTERGACHGDDACYDNHSDSEFWSVSTPKDRIIRDRLITMWTDFAKTGNPTPKKTDLITELWTPISSDKFNYMEIGNELKMLESLWPERRQLWEELYENL